MRNLEMNKVEPEMLTWEELLERQGTPVYILEAMENSGYWAIPWGADVVEGIGIVMLCHPEDVTDCGSQSMYGESFVAYTEEVPSRQGEIC